MKQVSIREARESMGLTQQDVADKLGISRQQYANIEVNPGNMTVERARRICSILGTEYERILFSTIAS